MLTQLAEERESTGLKAARQASMVEELRAEKKALLSKVSRALGSAKHDHVSQAAPVRVTGCQGAGLTLLQLWLMAQASIMQWQKPGLVTSSARVRQVNVLQGTARRKQVDAALSGTRKVSTLRPYADVLQDELTRREAALATAHADNERLQTAVRQQLAAKRTLNAEMQVPCCAMVCVV